MSDLTFYSHPISGNAHRVELFLSLLGLKSNVVEVDLMAGAQRKSEFLALNPAAQVPVLKDQDIVVAESNAILVYLATKYDHTHQWLPQDAVAASKVQKFLSIAAGPIQNGPANARLITLFNAPYDAEQTIKKSHQILTLLDNHLENREWLVGEQASIADVANYSYIASAPEGNVDLSQYHNINTWLTRIEALPHFVPFAKNAVGLLAA